MTDINNSMNDFPLVQEAEQLQRRYKRLEKKYQKLKKKKHQIAKKYKKLKKWKKLKANGKKLHKVIREGGKVKKQFRDNQRQIKRQQLRNYYSRVVKSKDEANKFRRNGFNIWNVRYTIGISYYETPVRTVTKFIVVAVKDNENERDIAYKCIEFHWLNELASVETPAEIQSITQITNTDLLDLPMGVLEYSDCIISQLNQNQDKSYQEINGRPGNCAYDMLKWFICTEHQLMTVDKLTNIIKYVSFKNKEKKSYKYLSVYDIQAIIDKTKLPISHYVLSPHNNLIYQNIFKRPQSNHIPVYSLIYKRHSNHCYLIINQDLV